ncbi:MAG: amidohydrolase family protein [Verrucomicrobiota bacterium]
MKIDAHQHFWDYSAEEYEWIDDSLVALQRDFAPIDLEGCLAEAGIDAAISVQARTSSEENQSLLAHAKGRNSIAGVVGWVDLTARDAIDHVSAFAAQDKAVGLREVLQGKPERDFCLRDDFNRGLDSLQDFGLCYDILIYRDQLGFASEMVDRHPTQVFILDHIAKPVIGTGGVDLEWKNGVESLARRENVACKVSGMVTECSEDFEISAESLRPWFDVVLNAFGPDRLLFGSDWPVCLARSTYQHWVDLVSDWKADFSPDERAAIWGRNAARFYTIG